MGKSFQSDKTCSRKRYDYRQTYHLVTLYMYFWFPHIFWIWIISFLWLYPIRAYHIVILIVYADFLYRVFFRIYYVSLLPLIFKVSIDLSKHEKFSQNLNGHFDNETECLWFKQYLFNIIYIVTYNTIWYGTESDGKLIAYMKVISWMSFNVSRLKGSL